MRVLATRRSVRAGDQDPDVDQLYAQESLREMLRECDYVVLAVPLTAETERMIGEAELRSMRAHAYLVNIGRGRVIDEEALVRALQEKWIGGAGLDVVKEEPSPFGRRYVIEGAMETPDGRNPSVRAVWFVRTGEDVPRFVTAYPLKGPDND